MSDSDVIDIANAAYAHILHEYMKTGDHAKLVEQYRHIRASLDISKRIPVQPPKTDITSHKK